jgi:hypothetical protein
MKKSSVGDTDPKQASKCGGSINIPHEKAKTSEQRSLINEH